MVPSPSPLAGGGHVSHFKKFWLMQQSSQLDHKLIIAPPSSNSPQDQSCLQQHLPPNPFPMKFCLTSTAPAAQNFENISNPPTIACSSSGGNNGPSFKNMVLLRKREAFGLRQYHGGTSNFAVSSCDSHVYGALEDDDAQRNGLAVPPPLLIADHHRHRNSEATAHSPIGNQESSSRSLNLRGASVYLDFQLLNEGGVSNQACGTESLSEQTASSRLRSEGDQQDDEAKPSAVVHNLSNLRSCKLCGTFKTPLWRSGPQGPKSLCNACGIRVKKARRLEAALLAAAEHSDGAKNVTVGSAAKQACKPFARPPLKRKLPDHLMVKERTASNGQQQFASSAYRPKHQRVKGSNNIAFVHRAKPMLQFINGDSGSLIKERLGVLDDDEEAHCSTSPSPSPPPLTPHSDRQLRISDWLRRNSSNIHSKNCFAGTVAQLLQSSHRGQEDEEAAVLLMALSCGLVLA